MIDGLVLASLAFVVSFFPLPFLLSFISVFSFVLYGVCGGS